MMNGSDLASTTASSPKSKEDQVVNGHDEKENNPFAEYMWMENEEDFNRQVEEELQEQEFLDRCFQEMLEEEDQDWFIPSRDLPQGMGQLQQQLNGLSVGDGHSSEDILVRTSENVLQGLAKSRDLSWEGGWVSFGGFPEWQRGVGARAGANALLMMHFGVFCKAICFIHVS
ncbi:polyadenylate-binding protein-interacting protein 2B isoform X1 [Grus americana]|nr:polyadenylate-binding protein-interacting protein 2B isoform X1 [Grus americana]